MYSNYRPGATYEVAFPVDEFQRLITFIDEIEFRTFAGVVSASDIRMQALGALNVIEGLLEWHCFDVAVERSLFEAARCLRRFKLPEELWSVFGATESLTLCFGGGIGGKQETLAYLKLNREFLQHEVLAKPDRCEGLVCAGWSRRGCDEIVDAYFQLEDQQLRFYRWSRLWGGGCDLAVRTPKSTANEKVTEATPQSARKIFQHSFYRKHLGAEWRKGGWTEAKCAAEWEKLTGLKVKSWERKAPACKHGIRPGVEVDYLGKAYTALTVGQFKEWIESNRKLLTDESLSAKDLDESLKKHVESYSE